MSDEDAIGAAIDEMYAMISGPAGPRDWSRQASCFLAEAQQVRTWVDENGRPQMKSMSLDDYARDTQPFFDANPFYEIETDRRIDFSAISRTYGALTKRVPLPTTKPLNAAASTPSSCSAIPSSAGGSCTWSGTTNVRR
jgi:hypothetical protein